MLRRSATAERRFVFTGDEKLTNYCS